MVADEGHAVTPQLSWRAYFVPIVLGFLSLVCISLSITIFIKEHQKMEPITFSSDMQKEGSDAGVMTDAVLTVDVEGAVVQPGIYRLPAGSRVEDVLTAAGGLTAEADVFQVSRSVNRAARLSDGAKIYIPAMREETDGNAGESDGGVLSLGINVNTASASELDTLSGVGPVTAQKIIDGRPYMRLEELVEKKVMSTNLFGKLKDQLTL